MTAFSRLFRVVLGTEIPYFSSKRHSKFISMLGPQASIGQSPAWWRKQWVRNSALGLLPILLIYTLAGFFLAPYLLKKQLISYLEKNLGAEVNIERVAINPYTLTLRTENFSLRQPGKPKLLSFQQFYADFELSSIWHQAWTFEVIRLIGPYLNLQISKNGQLNLAELVPPTKASPSKEGNKDPVPLISDQISIVEGHIHFVDQTQSIPVEKDLQEIDLDLKEFSTLLERSGSYSFEATTMLGEILRWGGDITLNPLYSKGHLVLVGGQARTLWQYLRDQVAFEVTSGRIDADADYTLDSRRGALQITLNNALVALSQLKLKMMNEEKKEILIVPKLDLSGGQVHWPERIVGIEKILMAETELYVWFNEQSMLSWQGLLAVKASEGEKILPVTDAPSIDWKIAIKKINVEDSSANFQDKTTESPVSVAISDLELQLTDITSVPSLESHFKLKFDVNERSRVSAKGTFKSLSPSLDAEVHLTQFPLPLFQPYLNRFVKLNLTSGNLAMDGKVEYAQNKDDPSFLFKGDLALQDLSTQDIFTDERFLGWNALNANQISVELFPTRIQVSNIELEAPYAKVVIAENNRINIKEVLGPVIERAEKEEKVETSPPSSSTPIPIAVNSILIREGTVNFADLSLPSEFSMDIHSLHGEIQNLSSRAEEKASVLLEGTIESYGLAIVKGEAEFFALTQAAVFEALFQNIKLPMLTPYARKFLGYTIEKGSLSLDLAYQIKTGYLEGKNRIIANDLTLGKKVESPEAINAPIRMAVALLKNPEGRIDIQFPVEGDLGSPQFSYGHIISKALTGFIGEVVSSPFRFLAGLVGAEETTLKFVEFRPASSKLLPPAQEKLLQLAEALKQRPKLQLQIQGQYDPVADARALKQEQLESLLSAQLKQETNSPNKKEPLLIRQQALIQLYIKQFSVEALNQVRTRYGLRPIESFREVNQFSLEIKPPAYWKTLQEQLINAQLISEDKLRQLAQARAATIKEHLINHGGIEGERVELPQVEPVKRSGQDLIRCPLDLSTE